MATRLTHLALPCRDLNATVAWYEDHTPMRTFHRRVDVDGEVAWLADEGSEFGLVVVQSFEARDSGEPQTILSPFAHLGFDVDGPAEVEAIAEQGRAEGWLHRGWRTEATAHWLPVRSHRSRRECGRFQLQSETRSLR